MTDKLPAVILAGGRATRMGGGDKCLLDMGGRPLLAHAIDRLAPQAGKLALNANGDGARFATFGLPVLGDTVPDWPGPLAGVLAAMDWAAEQGATQVVTVAADTPFFPLDLVDRLRDSGAKTALAATLHARRGTMRHPTFGLWATASASDLRAALAAGTRKVVAWADRHAAATVIFDTARDTDPFFNVNTPADLARARAIAEEKP